MVISHIFKFYLFYSWFSRRLGIYVIVLVLVRQVIISSPYDVLIFVIVMRRLFMFERFKQVNYL